ncbi:MAG: hypothetical protein OEU93_15290 [Rubrivivax sp.]|nr:hypothetical protein [Rubrivivax sp.]MDH5338348.1 hypothetical protein [Rubrivivax sp.]
MQTSLKTLLDRVPGARDALPHLAALEGALLKRGAAAVDAVPPAWLARIHAQLCSLPLPEDDLPLRDLHTRLQARLDRARRPVAPKITLPPLEKADPSMDMTRTVVIQEISHSEFMAVAGLQRDGGADPSR